MSQTAQVEYKASHKSVVALGEMLGVNENMKRKNHLYQKLLNPSLIEMAHELSKMGKAHYREVKMVDSNRDYYLGEILKTLENRAFKTSEYTIINKNDGRKDRIIHKLPYYPDRIVQHAIILVCGELWQRGFIRDTFQSIPRRGTSDARKRVLRAMKDKPKYFIKMDIKKYYPSVNNDIMKSVVRRRIKDADMLNLLDDIIDSTTGLPIGNYTSQYFGNLYLSEFDWWIKQEKGVKHYFRYCDDIIVLHNDKDELNKLKDEMNQQLAKIHLTIKDGCSIRNVDDGVDFCGYVFFHNYTLLRKSIATKFKRKALHIKKKWYHLPDSKVINSIMSYWGWVKSINAKNLWRSVVDYKLILIMKKFNPKVKVEI